jgi:two-component system cell cycle sensor histidine kinase/response regulator CckA
VAVALFTLVGVIGSAPMPTQTKVTLACGAVLLALLRRLVASGRTRAAAVVLCIAGWLAVSMDLPLHGQETVATGGFVVLVVIGGLAVGPAAAIALAVATVALMGLVFLGIVPVAPLETPGGGLRLTHYATQLGLGATLVAWWAGHMRALLLQLRTSEGQHAQLLEGSPDAIVRVDTSGVVTFCNGAVERILGYPASDLVGRRWDESPSLRPANDIGPLRAKVASTLEGGVLPAMEIELAHRDGRIVTLDVKGYPIQEDGGRIVGIVAILRDVSERKKAAAERLLLQEQLATSQRMEAVGSFAGGIAHDFNNILTVILSAIDQVGRDGAPGDAQAIGDARDAAMRGAALTRQLLTFGRRQPVQPRPLDLGATISALGPMLGRLLGGVVKLEMDIAAPPLVVLADPAQIDQVVVNLVVNARDAMPDGGTIRIAVRGATAHSPGVSGRVVAIEVTDDGSGMDEATKAHIFEPFFTTKGERGTGLGLAVVQGIVQRAGGAITCSSEPGAGATFRVEWPVADAPTAPARTERTSSFPAPGE